MKTKIFLYSLSIYLIGFTSCLNHIDKKTENSTGEPWSKEQLIEPETLANTLSEASDSSPIIYGIGPVGEIKGAIEIGPTQGEENIQKLKKVLEKQPKDKAIVIYCGCCPFEDCPNIRPAFKLLNDMKFTNHKLLNLSHNLKVDWIDKGFPIAE